MLCCQASLASPSESQRATAESFQSPDEAWRGLASLVSLSEL
ncbi:hypothetical protein A2U01_0073564, partial [Trifolium medium]|nr:hypothetical protein [Trifolium medium]